jgi:hypothetical protein
MRYGTALAAVLVGVSACHGIAPSTPSLISPTPVSQTPTALRVVPEPAQLPIGGGTALVRVELVAGVTGVQNTRVTLAASSGALSRADVLTDSTGHATVDWSGQESGTITAVAGAITGTAPIIVEVPPPPPPNVPPILQPPLPPPTPLPPPAPALTVTAMASPLQVAISTPVTLTAVVDNLHSGETVTAYQWDWDGGGVVDETTVAAVRAHTYTSDGIMAPKVTILTSSGRSTSASGRVIVYRP